MNEELMALSRRAIACTNWRWMPGMTAWRLTHRDEWVQVHFVKGLDNNSELADPDHTDSKKLMVASGHSVINGWYRIGDLLPNLTDPATLGCLLAIIREVYSDPCACVIPIDYGPAGVMWQVRLTANGRQVTERHYTTEIEALVAALEYANE